MSKSTLEIVREVIVQKLDIDGDRVVLEAEIAADLGADSLDAIELIIALEEIYQMEVDPEQVESLITVGDVVAIIDKASN